MTVAAFCHSGTTCHPPRRINTVPNHTLVISANVLGVFIVSSGWGLMLNFGGSDENPQRHLPYPLMMNTTHNCTPVIYCRMFAIRGVGGFATCVFGHATRGSCGT